MAFEAAMEAVSVARQRGRPRRRHDRVLTDAAYDADRIRWWCRRRGIAATIKVNGSRSEKLAVSYRAMAPVASIERYLRLLESPDTA